MGDTSKLTTAGIDADMVRYVAYLVRLGITDEQAAAFSQQFSAIIDYFQRLNEVDTSQTPPANQAGGRGNVLRDDEVRPSMEREAFLKNAPRHRDGCVEVPLVLDEA